ncbi:signal recognition particle protein [Cantharellus anzutake]|uniref:signal recognition particle protein n=1 Tax=Cantharellus anzutake TaxID=1750568 RepID=UPI001906C531|nr:signal recognition particle protein [Cantharellus anzutake]KAF8328848.1 signal recognition particle protein [Cantharellus anzutake]
MVLADLGSRIKSALSQLGQAPLVDDQVLDTLLKEICLALLDSDVNVKLVANLRNAVKAKVKQAIEGGADRGRDSNRRTIAQKAIFDELVNLVDPGVQPYQPKKGKPNVIMAVGLQGNGKTTTCTKLAVHYQRRGFKSAIVCADTFRAGAFDQTRQSATKARVAYFGSYTETDPVAIAAEGVTKFKKERFEVIIVDTSGRHRQEAELFEEMVQIGKAVQPDMTVLVMDASIGQAAESQSRAFKESADFGAIIVTKMDGHAKGEEPSRRNVAATTTPIIFIGTGEHMTDLEKFSPQPFISKLLGLGDMQGLVEHFQTIAMQDPERQKDIAKSIEEGKLSIRAWREQISTIMSMGPISKIASMIPGMPQEMINDSDEEGSMRLKRMIFITDSMTAKELDSDGMIFMTMDESGKVPAGVNWRVARVARGSGTSVREVEEMLCQYRMMSSMAKQMGGKNGMMSNFQKMASAAGPMMGPGGMPTREQVAAMQRAAPPGFIQKLRQGGGISGMQEMMKAMMGGNVSDEEMAEMQSESILNLTGMMNNLPGFGAGGMPNMGDLMKNFGGLGGLGGLGGRR